MFFLIFSIVRTNDEDKKSEMKKHSEDVITERAAADLKDTRNQ